MKVNRLPVILAIIGTIMVMNVSGNICKVDGDCNDKNNERCQKFDACDMGDCVCKEGYTTWMQDSSSPTGSTGVCFKLHKVGDTCANDTGTCGRNVKCWNGKCECRSSNYEEASDGNNCVFKTGTSLAAGSNCATGSCGGGSTCEGNVCTCPLRSTWSTTWRACIHDNSKMNLEEGHRCDDSLSVGKYWSTSLASPPYMYCGDKFTCSLCPEDAYKSGYAKRVCLKLSFNAADRTVVSIFTFAMATLGVALSAL